MADPGHIGNRMPHGEDYLVRRVADLERVVRELAAAQTLSAATIDNAPGKGIRTSDFNGTSFTDPGTVGNYVGGDGFVVRKMKLGDNLIPNDALITPVVPGVVNLYVSNFGLGSGAYTEVSGINITVPAGCTRLQFTGTAAIDCYNPKTTGGNNGVGGDYIYAQVRIGSKTSPGDWATGVSGNGGNATASRSYSDLLTGLTPGSTVRASVYGVSDYGIATSTGNLASLSAQLAWLR